MASGRMRGEEPMARHEFQPEEFHSTIGSHRPVLRVEPGDTVITSTADATGRDARGCQVAVPGNPQTGPFFVNGAEPGDALEIRFDRIWPNRDSAVAGTLIAPRALDPEYLRTAKAEQVIAEWHVDTEQGTARLVTPETGLGDFVLPIDPMLGCFGVAPDRGQAISTATSGPYGGNMDYRGFRAGVTVSLPVFVEGALFFLGDGHALQGEGEIAGNGLEVSMDVEFSVSLRKQAGIRWPRGENADHIFTVGNARPLDQAVQHATTEMLRWLHEDLHLDELGAHTLMGQCVEYDVGNVYDPAYTMVCKISKELLPALRGRY
jgi:acetamidase/formamidase